MKKKNLVHETCRHDLWENGDNDIISVRTEQVEYEINVEGSKNEFEQSKDDDADEGNHEINPFEENIHFNENLKT